MVSYFCISLQNSNEMYLKCYSTVCNPGHLYFRPVSAKSVCILIIQSTFIKVDYVGEVILASDMGEKQEWSRALGNANVVTCCL